MTIVIRDPETLAQIQAVTGRAEIRDAAGHPIGFFTPYPYVPPTTEEELQRIEQEPGGRSLAEILADLEKKA
jgi:hypothetical protein